MNALYLSSDSDVGTVTFSMPGNGYGVAFVVECASSSISDCQQQPPVVAITSPASSQPGDFNVDGHPDFVWQNDSTEQVTVWYMDGTDGANYLGWAWLDSAGEPGWKLVGSADFNGDGIPDLVWQNQSTGDVTVNYYSGPGGTAYQGWNYLRSPGVPNWRVVALADVDGNGLPDLINENDVTNQVTVNYIDYGPNGASYQGRWDWLNFAGEPAGWKVVGAADFDGNGVPDLVWQEQNTRAVTVNYYGEPGRITYLGWNWLNNGQPGWTVVGANDFNLDGVPDLVWQNDSTGQVTVNYYGGPGGADYMGWNWLDATGHLGWTPIIPN